MQRWQQFRLVLAFLQASCLIPYGCVAQVITTVAGTQWVFRGDGGSAKAAPLGLTGAMAVDAAGNIFVADLENHLVLRITPTGVLTVAAGNGIRGFSGEGGPAKSASLDFSFPSTGFLIDSVSGLQIFGGPSTGLAADAAGNLYVSDTGNNRIRKVKPDGTITTFVSLDAPSDIVLDPGGNLYVLQGNEILKIDAQGVMTTFAGTGNSGFLGDGGPARNAEFNSPSALALDAAGNLYVADTQNNRIRKITSAGIITTVAGNGRAGFTGDGGQAAAASLNQPQGVAIDSAGNLYVADAGNSRIRKVTRDGIISTVAGNGKETFAGDGGTAIGASLNQPGAVTVDSRGNVLIADSLNRRVRKVDSSGVITTVGGNGMYKIAGDGGPAPSATLSSPATLATDAAGNLYITDSSNNRIRRISPEGNITTVAGTEQGFSGDGGPALQAGLNSPAGVSVDPAGNIFIADTNNFRVRKVNPAGTITTVAGNGVRGSVGDSGPATSAALAVPQDVATDRGGNLYIGDNARVRRVTPEGTISTIVGGEIGNDGCAGKALTFVRGGLVVDQAGSLYIGDYYQVCRRDLGGGIVKFAGGGPGSDFVSIPTCGGFSSGSSSPLGEGGPATSVALRGIGGLAFDAAGNLYIAEAEGNRVRRVSTAGIITTVAGNGALGYSGDGGSATNASLNCPRGVAVDPAGNLYISDQGNDRIRRVLAASPAFSVAPASLSFSAPAGTPAVAHQLVAITSPAQGLAWSATTSNPWFIVSPTSGIMPALLSVSVDVRNLLVGTYRGTLTVQSPLANPAVRTVALEVTVLQPSEAKLELDRSSMIFESGTGRGDPLVQTLRISSGGGTATWTAQAKTLNGGNWLRLLSTSGSAAQSLASTLQVQADVSGLSSGVYSGLITIESPTSRQPLSVPVDLLLSQISQTIALSQTALQFTAVQGEAASTQSLAVVNTGQGIMNWTVRAETSNGGNWLTVSPPSGQSDPSSSAVSQFQAAVNTTGLQAGRYAGLITVEAPGANNSPRLVTVNLTMLPAGSKPGATLSPPGLIFSARAGSSSPSSQTVRLTTANPGPVEARGQSFTLDGGNWLQVAPTNLVVKANDPQTIVVQPLLGDLAPGQYHGSLTLQFSEGSPPQAVDIYFLVAPNSAQSTFSMESSSPGGAAAGCTRQKLIAVDQSVGANFTAQVGAVTNLQVQAVDDCGNPVSDTTVVASFSNGDPPVAMTYLRDGAYTGAWRPVNAGPTVTVTLRVTAFGLPVVGILQQGSVAAAGTAASIAPGGIVSAASFAPGGNAAPGSIVSLFGVNLTSTTAAATAVPLPRTLAGASVQIGGFQAPLFYAAGGQINVQIPFELQAGARPQVVVKAGTMITFPETITILPARPGIFTTNSQGFGQGVVTNPQGQLVDSGTPADAGDIVVVYATGLGATNPQVVSGQPAPGNPPATTTIPVTATVGGIPATVHFAGLTPSFVGLYQVNVQIPSGVTAGSAVPLILFQNGVPSNTATMTVR